jgi:hypothetical protein
MSVFLLYSKYSGVCKNFTDTIKQFNLQFFQFINIDSKANRALLKKVNITKLPCIIVMYNTGEKEVLEGRNAYVWFDKLLQKINKKEENMEENMEDEVKPKKKVRFERKEEVRDDMQSKSIMKDERTVPIRPKEMKGVMETASELAAGRAAADKPMTGPIRKMNEADDGKTNISLLVGDDEEEENDEE